MITDRTTRARLAARVNYHLRAIGEAPIARTAKPRERRPRRSELWKFMADLAELNGWSVSYIQTKRKKLEADGKIPKPDKLNPPRWFPETLARFYAQPAPEAEPAPAPKRITPRAAKPTAAHVPASHLATFMNRSA